MQVRKESKELDPCLCGFKPQHYTIGYGRTPYLIRCPECDKQTNFAKCKVTGSANNIIDYWNQHISKLTKDEMQKEVQEVKEERKREDPYNEYKVYTYYWTKNEGAVLYASC